MNRTELIQTIRDVVAGRDPKPPALELAEQRQRAAQEIARLRTEEAKRAPGLAAKVEKAREALRQAHKARDAAEAAHGRAFRESHGFSLRIEGEITRLEGELRATCNPRIDTFLEELRAEYQRTRREPPTVESETKWNLSRGSHVVETSSRPAQVARLERIREAIRAAEGLRLAVDADVTAELEKIRAAIEVPA